MKTLSEIVKDYPFSRITLERRMRLIPHFRDKYCTRGKYNKLLINDDGVKLITKEKHNSTSASFHTRKGTGSQLTKADLIQTIHQLLDLNSKQKNQIAHLKKSNKFQLEAGYHRQGLPSPSDIKEYKRGYKLQREQIRLLKENMKSMSFMDWLRNRF